MKYLNKYLIGMIVFAIATMAMPVRADWMNLTTGIGQVQVAKISVPATTSSAAVSGPSAFYGLIVKTDGVNNVTINVYDNTAASGTPLIPTDTVIAGSDRTWALSYNPAIKCTNGVYVSISVAGGGTATYQVQYDK